MHPDITNTRSHGKPVLTLERTAPNITYWWLIIISVLLRWLPFLFSTTSSPVDFQRVCIILSYLLLLFALLHNIRIWGARIVTIGTFLNFLAIIANRGFMPVSPDARSLAGKTLLKIPPSGITLTGSGGVVLPINQTRLWLFTDIIPFASFHIVFSIGDTILGFGILFACISLISWIMKTMHVRIHDSLLKD